MPVTATSGLAPLPVWGNQRPAGAVGRQTQGALAVQRQVQGRRHRQLSRRRRVDSGGRRYLGPHNL